MMDILFAMVLGGVLLLVVISANSIIAESQATTNGDVLVQEMLTSVAEIVEGEIRNMGFGAPENVPSVVLADTSDIRFIIDLDKDPITEVDTVEYFLGDTTELRKTPNPHDRLLYRRVNGGAAEPKGAVTMFHLQYLTLGGDTISAPVPSGRLSEIDVVELTLEVQNPQTLFRAQGSVQQGEEEALYSTSVWQQTRLASQNSRR